ncbi:helix-turn-helix domain-containing protein [Thalassospira marina]|nr:helix-turn-helix domain-containing protein [Thalassospira marina]
MIALERGGSRLRIPQKAEGSVLQEIVGIDAAEKIVKDLADERIEIPLAKKIVAAWLREQGWSQERIAMRLKVSRRSVQYWQSGTTPTRQSDLFSSF